ncbi:MAG: FAD-binding oxidoreductase [Candidatus Poribacteria bacterium]|nr:FAD-binding oxidoreductase [Candidatus Poribacteria bacterium]
METSNSLHDQLRRIVGESGILSEGQVSDYTYDSCIPKIVVMPASVQALQNVLRFASEQNLSVMPVGSGTKLGIGNLAPKTDIVLATTRLNKVIEYEPADLTVTVEAGIRLADLQTELAKNRQFLPLNPPYADRCTIGGIVSTNASGPLRLRYGTARNLVLGMHVTHATGTVVKSGGKVVKNVAGYDLNKLYIGAFGTLGIITEVTLKLAPLPAHEAILAVQSETIQDAVNIGLKVVCSQTLPTFVNLFVNVEFNQFHEKKPTLLVGFAGDPETVAWQLNSTQNLVEQNGSIGVQKIEGESHENICHIIQEFSAVDRKSDTVLVKVNLKRTDLAEFAEHGLKDTCQMMVLLGNGVLYLKIPIDSTTDFQQLADTLTQLRQRVIDVGGNLIIETAPPELKQQIDVWGPIGSTLKLMEQVKAKFDAKSVLNPGRFASNI